MKIFSFSIAALFSSLYTPAYSEGAPIVEIVFGAEYRMGSFCRRTHTSADEQFDLYLEFGCI